VFGVQTSGGTRRLIVDERFQKIKKINIFKKKLSFALVR
jgi:hypothetical protein